MTGTFCTSLSLSSGHSCPDEEFPQSTAERLSGWDAFICTADKTLQQRSHSSVFAAVTKLACKLVATLAIYCPCTCMPRYLFSGHTAWL